MFASVIFKQLSLTFDLLSMSRLTLVDGAILFMVIQTGDSGCYVDDVLYRRSL